MNSLRLVPVAIIALTAFLGLRILNFSSPELLVSVGSAVAQEIEEEKPADDPAKEADATQENAKDGEETAAADEKTQDTQETTNGNNEREIKPGEPKTAETDVLNSLGERRLAIRKREQELDMREKLLDATLKKMEQRALELRELEKKVGVAVETKKKQENERLVSLITMYEKMKAKDAARIFDRLDLRVLLPVAERIKPAKMATIMAKMSSEVAERLTIAMASQPIQNMQQADTQNRRLPKIGGN